MQTIFSGALALLLTTFVSTAAPETRLEDLDLSEATTGFGAVEKNLSVDRTPLSIGGKRFDHGLGVHARSEMLFRPEKKAARFQAKAGVDDGAIGPGTVVFRVVADGQTLFDSGIMKKGQPAKAVDVDLTGKSSVRLEVTDAGDGINYDHADWVDAVFTGKDDAPHLQPMALWADELPHYTGGPLKPATPPHELAKTGRVTSSVAMIDNHLAIQIAMNGRNVLEPSPVGVIVDGHDLGLGAKVGQIKTLEPYHEAEGLETHSRLHQIDEIELTTGDVHWSLEVRTSAEGVGWRYKVEGTKDRRITGESTAFILPEKSIYWAQTDTRAYEGSITRFDPERKGGNRPLGMPVTVELPTGGYLCLTEVNTMDYSGMTLGPDGRILAGIFEDDPKGWTMPGAFESPWRAVIVAADLTELVNSTLVRNLAYLKSPDEGGTRSPWWAPPGRAYWTWFFGGSDTAKWDRIKGYIDDAASLNCTYYTIDDPWRNPSMGWHRNGHDEWASLKEFCEYAETKKVKLIVWQHWAEIRDEKARETFFEKVAKSGAAGVKIDFMESESHERQEFYHSCLELGELYHLIVDFHGANKPAGEDVVWPLALTREGIRGLEQRGGLTRSHLASLPFTRLVTGPGDFTPTTFRPDQLYATTVGMQLATSIAYNSPLMHWADSASVYLKQAPEIVEIIRNKPVVWDQTLVLPGSKIGELAVMARRSGKDWWICGLNGMDHETAYSFDLSFLKAASERAVLIQDAPGDKTRFAITLPTVSPGQKIDVKMAPGGGFVMVLYADPR